MNGWRPSKRGSWRRAVLLLAMLLLALSAGGALASSTAPPVQDAGASVAIEVAIEESRGDGSESTAGPRAAVSFQNESRAVAGSAESGLVVAIAFGLVGLLLVTRRRLVRHP